MNKKLLIIIIFLVFLFSISAEPITVLGYGKTCEEAENNALLELSAFISTEVSSTTSSSTSIENDKITSNTFSDNSILTSNSKLFGVKYNSKPNVNGMKCSEAIILDIDTVQIQYKTRINDLITEINKTNLLLDKTNNINDKLQYLEFIFDYIKTYKNYRFIMLHLNYSWEVPQLSISEIALKVEY